MGGYSYKLRILNNNTPDVTQSIQQLLCSIHILWNRESHPVLVLLFLKVFLEIIFFIFPSKM